MKSLKVWLLFLQIPVVLCSGSQWFAEFQGRLAVDTPVFTPLEDLSFISSEQHTSLTHPAFPQHAVRIKKSHGFCDPTVNSYTGYIDIGSRHLFFYFFESRTDPDKDDVIFWTNGGPGCSSATGLFMELGPCKIKDGNTTTPNPFSWNMNANIFFIDQPVGTGFSYADYGEVSTTEEAAKDIASFVAIFFEHFVKFRGRAFHMAGESYAGRYLPVYASEIFDQNTRLVEAGITPINLQSVMLGNGWTDILPQLISSYHFVCENISASPVLSINTCVKMKAALPRCQRWMKASCIDIFDKIDCWAASSFCLETIWGLYDTSGLNPYDIRKQCEGAYEETMCYPYIGKNIVSFLNLASTRSELGISPARNFTSCNLDLASRFFTSADFIHGQTQHYVAALLERGVRVLAYAGSYDFLCNWVGIRDWTLNLEWSGKEAFGQEELREWKVNGRKAGVVRMSGGLAFATIDGGGHMAPYDQPEESLALVQRWLAKQDI